MEERYHATTQNRFYPYMSNVNKNITVEAKLISPPTYIHSVTTMVSHLLSAHQHTDGISHCLLTVCEPFTRCYAHFALYKYTQYSCYRKYCV